MALPRVVPAAALVAIGLLIFLGADAVNAQGLLPGSTRDAHLSTADGQPVHPSAAAGAILWGLGAIAVAAGVYLGAVHGLRRCRRARLARGVRAPVVERATRRTRPPR